jgi:hypothetical protein
MAKGPPLAVCDRFKNCCSASSRWLMLPPYRVACHAFNFVIRSYQRQRQRRRGRGGCGPIAKPGQLLKKASQARRFSTSTVSRSRPKK